MSRSRGESGSPAGWEPCDKADWKSIGNLRYIDLFDKAEMRPAGVSNNRTVLPSNNGAWPNLIKFDPTDTISVVQGQNASVTFCQQWAQVFSTPAESGSY